MFRGLFGIRPAEWIIRAPEYEPFAASLIKVHLPAANMTKRLIFDFSSTGIGRELPAADKAYEPLFAAFGLSVFIKRGRFAIRALQLGWYCLFHHRFHTDI